MRYIIKHKNETHCTVYRKGLFWKSKIAEVTKTKNVNNGGLKYKITCKNQPIEMVFAIGLALTNNVNIFSVMMKG